MTRYWMAIAIPPPQRGKHCNTITTSTPAVPPVITTNVLSCANVSYNPRTGIVTKIQAFGVQTNTVSCNSTAKNFTKTLNYWECVENNMWKQQKYNQIVKEMRRQLLAATTVQGTHSYYTRQWAPAGTMHCAGPFRPTLLLYCTHRCCITVLLQTQVLYKYLKTQKTNESQTWHPLKRQVLNLPPLHSTKF